MKKKEICGELTSKGSAEGTLLLQDANHNASDMEREATGEIILYQPDETLSLQVKLDAAHDTVWLTQQQMVDLFKSSKANISEHIANIYQQGELTRLSTVRNFRTVVYGMPIPMSAV